MVSIIIPTYNAFEHFQKCLLSVLEHTELTDVEIIVSANGAPEELRNFLVDKPVELLWSDEPLGYPKAVNVALRVARGEHVVLLNDDCFLQTQEKGTWLRRLMAPFADAAVGITGPSRQRSGAAGRDFVIFFCAALSRKLLDQVGGLDEVFSPGSGEDTDLCCRAEDAGFKVVAVADLVYSQEVGLFVGDYPLYHRGEATVFTLPKWKEIYAKNSALLAERYRKPLRVNLGCGDQVSEDYVNVDLYNPRADIEGDVRKLFFSDESVGEVLASHILEHFDFFEAREVLSEWVRVLKPGGKIVIETPDMLGSCRAFVESSGTRGDMYGHFFAKPWIPGEIHKFLYTEDQLGWTMQNAGLRDVHREVAVRFPGQEDINLRMVGVK